MKRLLVSLVLSMVLLISCTKPLDNIVILNVKDKDVTSAETVLQTTPASVDTTTVYSLTTTESNVTTVYTPTGDERVLIINKSSKKVHLSDQCSYAAKISDKNKIVSPYEQLYTYLEDGYEVCSYCEKHY